MIRRWEDNHMGQVQIQQSVISTIWRQDVCLVSNTYTSFIYNVWDDNGNESKLSNAKVQM